MEEDSVAVDYSKFDKNTTKVSADKYFGLALSSSDAKEKENYLNRACAKYYVLSNIDKSDSYPVIMLGRIYEMQKNDRYAKAYFSRALGLNYKDIDANYYFAEYYYNRKQYKNALEYYNKALIYGKEGDAATYKKIGKIYERFGDLRRANFYYKECKRLEAQDKNLPQETQQQQSSPVHAAKNTVKGE